ncbi:hypothetical protein SVAN01_02187, partial [Stagonosporopsis vannaccii]
AGAGGAAGAAACEGRASGGQGSPATAGAAGEAGERAWVKLQGGAGRAAGPVVRLQAPGGGRRHRAGQGRRAAT